MRVLKTSAEDSFNEYPEYPVHACCLSVLYNAVQTRVQTCEGQHGIANSGLKDWDVSQPSYLRVTEQTDYQAAASLDVAPCPPELCRGLTVGTKVAKRSTLSVVDGLLSVVAGGSDARSVTMNSLELMASFRKSGFIFCVKQSAKCKCVAIHPRTSP